VTMIMFCVKEPGVAHLSQHLEPGGVGRGREPGSRVKVEVAPRRTHLLNQGREDADEHPAPLAQRHLHHHIASHPQPLPSQPRAPGSCPLLTAPRRRIHNNCTGTRPAATLAATTRRMPLRNTRAPPAEEAAGHAQLEACPLQHTV
jgi:hypothetical protein